MDFAKAFDRVYHEVLLNQLEPVGVCDSLWKWFESYLSKRTEYVAVKGYKSMPCTCTLGFKAPI